MKKNSIPPQESNVKRVDEFRVNRVVVCVVIAVVIGLFIFGFVSFSKGDPAPSTTSDTSQAVFTDDSQFGLDTTSAMNNLTESSETMFSIGKPTELETTLEQTSITKITESTVTQTVAPMLPLQGRVIGIDPGHQLQGDYSQEAIAPGSSETKAKVSTGASGYLTGRTEESINLEIAFLLRDKLQALGAEVVLTRDTSDINISNQERAGLMNERGVDACLRIHCNGANDHAVQGAEMYVKTNDSDSYALAEFILSEVCNMVGANRRAVYESSTYTGLNWSEVPSVLVELGFLSNADEEAKLIDPVFQERYAEAMAIALQKWLDTRP